jgi:hypothetical protein
MKAHAIFYYPIDYAIRIVRDESLPVVDKVISVAKESSGDDSFWSVDFEIYRWSNFFIVKHTVDFSCSYKYSKEDIYLTVLTSNDGHLAIVDWVDLVRSSVFTLPSYFLNEYIESLVRRGWFVFLSQEDELWKKKRRFGFDFSCLRDVFQEEWVEIERLEKKGAGK